MAGHEHEHSANASAGAAGPGVDADAEADAGATALPPSGGLLDALRGLLAPPHFQPRVPAVAGLEFGPRHRGIAPLADVYLPDAPGPHPSVVLVHGGGFINGSRAMKPMRFLATRLAEAGVAAMTFDYRMIFRGGRLGESVADVATALRWWREQAGRFELDPARVTLMGLSAGASLTMLTAAELPPATLDRVVGVFGVYDFSALQGRRAGLMRRWLFQSDDPETWRQRSPIAVTERVPHRVLLIHGTGDVMVPAQHSRRLAARRRELGLPVEDLYVAGAPHGFFNTARHQAAADQAVAATLRFLGP
ncbi:MAG: alpha/beta hydrolase fold domain-containing protein [Deltaproteobacteria bacterium]|nr:alpha/beta hydrolase fold domain-containing protein [Deltaproteobacteria bacterium]